MGTYSNNFLYFTKVADIIQASKVIKKLNTLAP